MIEERPLPDCKACGHPFFDHWMGHAPCAHSCVDTCRIADFTGRTDEGERHTSECCKCPCYEAKEVQAGTWREFYAARWEEWKKDARANGMTEVAIADLEASLDKLRAEHYAKIQGGTCCGLPLRVQKDPWGRTIVHVSCFANCGFLIALEAGHLKEIQNECRSSQSS